jgi:hypothetical protein
VADSCASYETKPEILFHRHRERDCVIAAVKVVAFWNVDRTLEGELAEATKAHPLCTTAITSKTSTRRAE